MRDYRIQANIWAIKNRHLHIIKDIYWDLDVKGLLLIWKKRLLFMKIASVLHDARVIFKYRVVGWLWFSEKDYTSK